MKNLYLSLSFLFASSITIAQNKETKDADKLYNRYEYVSAAKEYLKLVDANKADNYVYKQLADSYYNIFNTTEAIKWYAKLTEASTQDAETHYRFAQMLKANGEYNEANKQMHTFAALAPTDNRAISFMKDPNYIAKLNDQEKMYEIKNLDINSDKSDFGAFLTSDNELYFASGRNTSKRNYGWNNEPYLDIYKAIYNSDGSFSAPTAVKDLNSRYHDGPITMSADGNVIYFASESFKDRLYVKDAATKSKYGRVNLFKATKVDGKWGNIQGLPFNSKDYSTSNPSLSKDGKTLYFSSDMPGSLGKTDIWKVSIDENGSYGTPENLGSTINTAGRESFPFINVDNKLYFSSDDHNGFGGYDVFVADLTKEIEVKNLGKPVNSEKDDFAFTYNTSKKIGFFSSNRNSQDDLYAANQLCKTNLIATVIDAKTGLMVGEANAIILENNKVISKASSDAEGKFSFNLPCDKEYTVQVSKEGYEIHTQPIVKTDVEINPITIQLKPIDPIITETEILLADIHFEFNKSNITQQGATELDKLVTIMNDHPTMEIMVNAHTDNRGSDQYNLSLSERRAKSTVQYVISKGIASTRIASKGYGETMPKINCGAKCKKEEHTKNRRSEFLITKK